MRRSIFYSVILFFTLTALFSCKTLKHKKKIAGGMTATQLYDSISANKLNFKALSSKFTVKYKSEKSSMSLKGNLKMIQDSVIWISLSPGLGIEAARLICTKDSIFLIDRLKKRITKAKYDFFTKKFNLPVDYNIVESILTNQFFVYPKVDDTKSAFFNKFRLSADNENIILDKTSKEAIENLIKISKKTFTVSNCSMIDIKNKRSLKINYTLGQFQGVKHFPSDVNIVSLAGSKSLTANLHYKKVSFPASLKVSYNFPASYKVIKH